MKYKLDSIEQKIENEAEGYKKISGQKKKKIEEILMRSSKRKVVTLRLNDEDLEKIKSMAVIEGIPYQTLISSVLHKFSNQRYFEKNEVLKIVHLAK
ncbi:MAG: antitoxin [Candidatus Margulisiibacteriota bacterium]|jgi:predicted DNA binding CopG/RHH family protein